MYLLSLLMSISTFHFGFHQDPYLSSHDKNRQTLSQPSPNLGSASFLRKGGNFQLCIGKMDSPEN
jgi:hypothetical protein